MVSFDEEDKKQALCVVCKRPACICDSKTIVKCEREMLEEDIDNITKDDNAS